MHSCVLSRARGYELQTQRLLSSGYWGKMRTVVAGLHGGGAPRTAAPTSRTQPGLLSLCNTTMSQAAITTLRYQDDMDASTSASRSTLLLLSITMEAAYIMLCYCFFFAHHGGPQSTAVDLVLLLRLYSTTMDSAQSHRVIVLPTMGARRPTSYALHCYCVPGKVDDLLDSYTG